MQWHDGEKKKTYLTNNCKCENSSHAPLSICLEFMDTRLLWCKDTAVGKAIILQKRLMNVWTLKMGTGPSIYHVIRFKCLWKPTPHPILHNIGTAPNLWCPKDVPLNFQNISTPNIFTFRGSVHDMICDINECEDRGGGSMMGRRPKASTMCPTSHCFKRNVMWCHVM